MAIRIFLLLMISTLTFGCGKKERQSAKPPVYSAEPGALCLFPKPPSGWAGTENPYPTTGWVGDVMPYFNDGQFEIFFLHDATDQIKAQSSGEHPIHKFTSTNLVDFRYEGEMIPYGDVQSAEHLLGTGSVVKANAGYYFFYTGHNGSEAWMADNPREIVRYAYSKDLDTWEKKQGFDLSASIHDGYDQNNFRDPHVFYNEEFGAYWMLISTRKDDRGVLALYTTDDPASNKWTLQEPLEIEGDYFMLECADIFKMGDLYYLLFSEDWSDSPGTHYRVANSSKGPWKKPQHGNDMFDGHQFYAGKTASDGAHRYVFAWAHRRNPENDNGQRTWAGNLIVHEIERQPDGSLGVKSLDMLGSLFSKQDALTIEEKTANVIEHQGGISLDGTSSVAYAIFNQLNNTQRIEANVLLDNTSGTFSVFFNADGPTLKDVYEIVFEPQNGRIISQNMGKETTHISLGLEPKHVYNLEIVINKSICILYIDGKKALTNRIYNMVEQGWGFKADGISAAVTEIKSSIVNDNS